MSTKNTSQKRPMLVMDERIIVDYKHILDLDNGIPSPEDSISFVGGSDESSEEIMHDEKNYATHISSLSIEWPELQTSSSLNDTTFSHDDEENNYSKDAIGDDVSSMYSWDKVGVQSDAWDVVSDMSSVKSFNTFSSCIVDVKAKSEASSYRDAVLKNLPSASTNNFNGKKKNSRADLPKKTRFAGAPITLARVEEKAVNDDLSCFRNGIKEAKGGKTQYMYKGNPKNHRYRTSRLSRRARSFDQLGRAEMVMSRRAELKKVARTVTQKQIWQL